MRVTGVIKDYIKNEVNDKYKTKVSQIQKPEYEINREKCIEEIKRLTEESSKKAIAIAEKYNMYDRDYYNWSDRKNIIYYDTSTVRNQDEINKIENSKRTLEKERDNKIAQIILDLELGETNKRELTNILQNIEF